VTPLRKRTTQAFASATSHS